MWKVIFFVMPVLVDFCMIFIPLFQTLSGRLILGNVFSSLKKQTNKTPNKNQNQQKTLWSNILSRTNIFFT